MEVRPVACAQLRRRFGTRRGIDNEWSSFGIPSRSRPALLREWQAVELSAGRSLRSGPTKPSFWQFGRPAGARERPDESGAERGRRVGGEGESVVARGDVMRCDATEGVGSAVVGGLGVGVLWLVVNNSPAGFGR